MSTGLRVGLTGGLGSGKSTAAAMLAKRGAQVLSADEMARELMEPGHTVYAAIVKHFGRGVVREDKTLDRAALARIAFGEGRVDELNAIVHPATIARQGELTEAIFARDPGAVVVVESALIFESKYGESKYGAGWRGRFDRMVLVTANEEIKIARFVARSGGDDVAALAADARRRLGQMIPDQQKVAEVDYVLQNNGTLAELEGKVEALWRDLQRVRAEAASGV